MENVQHQNCNSIEKLNDHCLQLIFCHLSFRDCMKVQRVCKRWQAIVEYYSWWDIRHITLSSISADDDSLQMFTSRFSGILNTCAIEKVLTLSGFYLHQLTLDINDTTLLTRIMPLVVKHCENLTWLQRNISVKKGAMELIFSRSPMLETVLPNTRRQHVEELYEIVYDQYWSNKQLGKQTTIDVESPTRFGLAHSAFEPLRDLCLLRALKFEGIELNSKDLEMLLKNKSLSNLHFRDCYLDDDSIFAVTNLKNLQHLTIEYCNTKQISDDLLHRVAKHCQKLKYLKAVPSMNNRDHREITLKSSVAEIAKLPLLEQLYFRNVNLVIESMSPMANLKIFSCPGCCFSNKAAIVSLIENAGNLEYLNIVNTWTSRAVLDSATRITQTRTNGVVLSIQSFNSWKTRITTTKKPTYLRSI